MLSNAEAQRGKKEQRQSRGSNRDAPTTQASYSIVLGGHLDDLAAVLRAPTGSICALTVSGTDCLHKRAPPNLRQVEPALAECRRQSTHFGSPQHLRMAQRSFLIALPASSLSRRRSYCKKTRVQ